MVAVATLLALALPRAGQPEAQGPAVVLDEGVPALGCAAHAHLVQGPPLAIPASRLAPAPADAWGQGDTEGAIFRTASTLDTGGGTFTRSRLVRNADGTASVQTLEWDAAALLAAMAPDKRRIYTLDRGGPPAEATVPFEWARLPAAQRAALDARPAPGAGSDGLGAARVAWLRGTRLLEGTTFRRRASLLGDALQVPSVYLGPGANRYRDAGYTAFYARTLARQPAVYLAANDGMVHAFDAASGAELFAYIPAMVVPHLNALTAPDFMHRSVLDGPLTTGEAIVGGTWRSVLVGSAGAGARGVYALDVTDPGAFGLAGGALWEFTQADDAALGNVLQPVQVARLRQGRRGGSPFTDYAVTGNGVNGAVPDGPRAALFLLALDKPAGTPWRRGSNYFRLDTPRVEGTLPSGLGAPALVTDDDGVLRTAYAGDLQGNLWRFDFRPPDPWRAVQVPVFVARDAAGRRQPIAQQPKVVHAEGGGYLVSFGTGVLYNRAGRDPAAFQPQSYYAVFDDPSAPARAAPLGRHDLAARQATDEGSQVVVTGSMATIGPGEHPQGWYFDLPGSETGERSLAPATLADGKVVFTTVVPGRDPCADSVSRLYVLDALSGLPAGADGLPMTGGATGTLLPGYAATAPLLLAGPRTAGSPDPTGGIAVKHRTAIVPFVADGPAPAVGTEVAAAWRAGRLSWREVANWRELHRRAAQQGMP